MAAAPTAGGIGRTLREARERRGMSLRQIANATRISLPVLEGLERNDISKLPGGIFSRAFVRSYAVEVGLDPEETIRQFIGQFPVESVTAGHPASRSTDEELAADGETRTATTLLWMVVASAVIGGLILFFARSADVVIDPADSPVLAATDVPLAGSAAPAGSAPGPGDVPDRLRVSLVAAAPCWVSATVDGELAFERELHAGDREVLDARTEIVLTAGNAGALRLTLNGLDARPLGAMGEVVTARMSPASFREYLVVP